MKRPSLPSTTSRGMSSFCLKLENCPRSSTAIPSTSTTAGYVGLNQLRFDANNIVRCLSLDLSKQLLRGNQTDQEQEKTANPSHRLILLHHQLNLLMQIVPQ